LQPFIRPYCIRAVEMIYQFLKLISLVCFDPWEISSQTRYILVHHVSPNNYSQISSTHPLSPFSYSPSTSSTSSFLLTDETLTTLQHFKRDERVFNSKWMLDWIQDELGSINRKLSGRGISTPSKTSRIHKCRPLRHHTKAYSPSLSSSEFSSSSLRSKPIQA
jgi:hypothetical protein